MCGIVGYRGQSHRTIDLASSLRSIRQRGPDDTGQWHAADAGIGLGHVRLSILDLSRAGAQPMLSRCGRYVIAFNGEIYNHHSIRRELDAAHPSPGWRGHSDTEVLLEAIAFWGLEATLPRLNGMFAFALWDRSEHRLHLARDRFGEKPLYYGWASDTFVFGSELKALRVLPGFRSDIDQEALAGYLRFGAVPSPQSIYRGILKLPPGTSLTLEPRHRPGDVVAPKHYWDPADAVSSALCNPFPGDESEAVEELDRLMREVVALRMEADVPLGALLSGGVDSSLVVAMMQAQGGRKVRTFSIGSRESGFDEAPYARSVASHLGTEHTELYVEPQQALDVIPRLPALYDEPFADSSQIPTFLVSQMARQHVTVALSGDAGDELFGGYNRYFHGQRVWAWASKLPSPVRRSLGAALLSSAPETWNRLARNLSWLLPAELGNGRTGEKLHKLGNVLAVGSEKEFHQSLLSCWPDPSSLLLSRAQGLILPGNQPFPAGLDSFSARAMYLDACHYLPDDILTKVDRASMGVSLEVRVPFLDARVFDLAWRLPMSMKIRHGRGKHVLRKVLDRYVPRDLIDRPKQGFAVPVGRWLRSELRDWGEALLGERRLAEEGFFDPALVRRCWNEHQNGHRDWESRLWAVLMFQSWLDEQRLRI